MLPSRRQLDRIHTLWDELTDFAPTQTEAALNHLFAGIAALIDADNAMWFGVVRLQHGKAAQSDPTRGWRSPAIHPWKPDPERERLIQLFLRSLEARSDVSVGQTTVQMMAEAGTFRVHRLRDGWIDFAAFRATQHYDIYYRRIGLGDRVWIGFPVNDTAESIFIFDRNGPRRRFTAAEAELAGYALRGIKWFHRELLLRHGVLAAKARLTPTEWRVIPHLLSDRTEKEIAQALGLTFDATHRHARGIYQKFAVRGRADLMVLWFGP